MTRTGFGGDKISSSSGTETSVLLKREDKRSSSLSSTLITFGGMVLSLAWSGWHHCLGSLTLKSSVHWTRENIWRNTCAIILLPTDDTKMGLKCASEEKEEQEMIIMLWNEHFGYLNWHPHQQKDKRSAEFGAERFIGNARRLQSFDRSKDAKTFTTFQLFDW